MHPDKNCKFLAACLLVLMFAMLPLFCDQAFSLGGVALIHWVCIYVSMYLCIYLSIYLPANDSATVRLLLPNENWPFKIHAYHSQHLTEQTVSADMARTCWLKLIRQIWHYNPKVDKIFMHTTALHIYKSHILYIQ